MLWNPPLHFCICERRNLLALGLDDLKWASYALPIEPQGMTNPTSGYTDRTSGYQTPALQGATIGLSHYAYSNQVFSSEKKEPLWKSGTTTDHRRFWPTNRPTGLITEDGESCMMMTGLDRSF